MASSNSRNTKYVYDLPFMVNRELCRILDQSDKWEELAGIHMGYRMLDIQHLRKQQGSPTEQLLSLWGQRNHTIYELFVHLSRMQHFQAMVVLKPFIDPRYHVLINEGEESISRLLNLDSDKSERSYSHRTANSNTECFDGNENFNIPQTGAASRQKCEEKILNLPQAAAGRHNAAGPSGVQPHDMAKGVPGKTLPGKDSSSIHPPPSTPTRRESEDSNIFTEGLSSSIPQIPYKELCVATNQWDRKNVLGRGGFGIVFRGSWKNTQVAIKRIEQRGGSEAAGGSYQAQLEQSSKELKILNSVRHDNVLPLYGFSVGGEHPCLIYQLMPNGSLEDRLQCRGGTAPLSWKHRHNIALGTACGLQFLHTIRDKPLIHGDIKSANILLDANWQPRIGDFGLAREGPIAKYTHIILTKVHGTRPYLPDEFLRSKQSSTKVDTFSFGIVLFEIATGQRAFEDSRTPKLLKDVIKNRELATLMDPRAPADHRNAHLGRMVFQELVTLGQKCTAGNPKNRPEMVTVLQDLKNIEEQREIVSRAQSLVHSPSPCPSNPLEIQMFYDAQQRRASLESPWNMQGMGESNAQSAMGNPRIMTPRVPESLRVDIPTQDMVLGYNAYLTPTPHRTMQSPQGTSPNFLRNYSHQPNSQQASSNVPAVSPSIMIQDFPTSSIPSTQPTMNPFLTPSPSPQLGASPNPNSFFPSYQHFPSVSPNFQANHTQQSYQLPVSVSPINMNRVSPLLVDQQLDAATSQMSSKTSSAPITDSNVLSSSQPSILIPTVIPGNSQALDTNSYIPAFSMLGLSDKQEEVTPASSIMVTPATQDLCTCDEGMTTVVPQQGVPDTEQSRISPPAPTLTASN